MSMLSELEFRSKIFMIKTINGATFRKMIIAGASLLEQNKKYVDSLNVFPVPDGDTGTNMFLTMKSAMNEVTQCPNNTVEALSSAFAKGALNIVILSTRYD